MYNHFIRGFYDGDGGINNIFSGALLAMVGTYNMLINIKEIIEKECDINFPIYKMGKIFKIQTGGNRQVVRVLNWVYKDASIFLERKYNRYLELLALNKTQDQKYRPYIFISNEIILEIIKQYKCGLGSTTIGNNLGIERNRILRILKKNNVKIRK